MIEHIWTVICSRSIIDSETNNISLLETLEQLTIESPIESNEAATISVGFEIVSYWVRSNAEVGAKGRGNIVLENPAGASVNEIPFEIDLDSYPRLRTRIKFFGFPATPGRYNFSVQVSTDEQTEWASVVKVPIFVVATEQTGSSVGETS